MMTLLQALILGIVQGVTEFFPVSSSTHISLFKSLMQLPQEVGTPLFDLICHLGTLSTAIYTFRSDIYSLLTTRKDKLFQIFIALIPLIPGIILFKSLRESVHGFCALGGTLLITSLLLFLGDTLRIKQIASITWQRRARDALYIGTMQATSLIPGVSRSASTIVCARFLGWNAQEAVRFSFLLAIPTISGGCLYELYHALFHSPIDLAMPISPSCCLMGFGASAVGAAFVIGPAIRYLTKGRLRLFAWYCLILSVGLILGSLFWRK